MVYVNMCRLLKIKINGDERLIVFPIKLLKINVTFFMFAVWQLIALSISFGFLYLTQ